MGGWVGGQSPTHQGYSELTLRVCCLCKSFICMQCAAEAGSTDSAECNLEKIEYSVYFLLWVNTIFVLPEHDYIWQWMLMYVMGGNAA